VRRDRRVSAAARRAAREAGRLDDLRQHLAAFVAPDPKALVFAGPKGAALRRNPAPRWRT
jgi:hypothetical protein